MLKYVYVDTENVATPSWYHCIKFLTPRDMLVLPWSDHSGKIPLQLLSQLGFPTCRVEYVPCMNGQPNAMDFTLVAALTKHMIAAPKSLHLVISKDKGYISAIQYLEKTTNARIEIMNTFGNYKSSHPSEFQDGKWIL